MPFLVCLKSFSEKEKHNDGRAVIKSGKSLISWDNGAVYLVFCCNWQSWNAINPIQITVNSPINYLINDLCRNGAEKTAFYWNWYYMEWKQNNRKFHFMFLLDWYRWQLLYSTDITNFLWICNFVRELFSVFSPHRKFHFLLSKFHVKHVIVIFYFGSMLKAYSGCFTRISSRLFLGN